MKILLSFLLLTVTAFSQESDRLKYLRYDTGVVPKDEYQRRRDSVRSMIGQDAAAVFYGAPERMRNGDVDFVYRQADNFYYLTGCTEPNALLILSPKGIRIKTDDSTSATVNEVLFVQDRNPHSESWTGRRLGAEGAMTILGFQSALPNDKFKTVFQQMLFSRIKYLYLQPITSDVSGEIRTLLTPVQSYLDNFKKHNSKIEIRDPNAMIHTMRIVKSPYEIAMLRKASEISVVGHNQAMASVEPGMFEYELQALYEYAFTRQGAEYYGYPCINGSAENSVILHYNTNRKKIADGDIILSDCAAEYRGYSSDVTRSYPANGKFSKEQRAVYQIVLDAEKAAIAKIKPGVVWSEVSAAADSVLTEGLFSLGIIAEKSRSELRKFYPHGLGHPVGLNVHDVSGSPLSTGMVYTVEPGIYIPETAAGVDRKFHNIGIRIEDVILVTDDGNENLSAGSPREISEIESLMKKKGIGNQPLK